MHYLSLIVSWKCCRASWANCSLCTQSCVWCVGVFICAIEQNRCKTTGKENWFHWSTALFGLTTLPALTRPRFHSPPALSCWAGLEGPTLNAVKILHTLTSTLPLPLPVKPDNKTHQSSSPCIKPTYWVQDASAKNRSYEKRLLLQ